MKNDVRVAWDKLTTSQREAASRLADLLMEAVDASDRPDVAEGSQVAFLTGRRGTGKTAILQLFHDTVKSRRTDESLKSVNPVRMLFDKHKEHLFWLPPIQLDPLPQGANITGAVLAGLAEASLFGGREGQRAGGVLDPNGGLDRARTRLGSLQAKALLAIEGNLNERRGAVDQDTFAVNVMDNERSRPTIRNKMNDILNQVLARGSEEYLTGTKGIFVIVIDDIDIRPNRAVDALQLASLLAIPRLFFIFSGEIETVDQLLLYKTQKEFLDAVGATKLDPFLQNDIEGRSNEIASSLLRKLIPPARQIEVKTVTFDDFDKEMWPKPLGGRGLPLGDSRYLKDKWDLNWLLTSEWKVAGSEQVFCVAPRQLRDLGRALDSVAPKDPDKTTPLNREQLNKLVDALRGAFQTLVDEDRMLGIPAQRKLKEMLDPADSQRVFTVDGLKIDARFGEGVTVELEVEDEANAGAPVVSIEGRTAIRRDLTITAKNRDRPNEPERRRFGADSAAMYMLLHDVCALSRDLEIEGELCWSEEAGSELARTSLETLDGLGRWCVEWQTVRWPTFRHQQIFLDRWNAVVRRLRNVQHQQSNVSGNDIAKLLVVGYAQSVVEAAGHSILELENAANMHVATDLWKDQQSPWQNKNSIETCCGSLDPTIRSLLKQLISRAGRGEEDDIYEFGIAVIVQLCWLFDDLVRVFTASDKGRPTLQEVRNAAKKAAGNDKMLQMCANRVGNRVARALERLKARVLSHRPESLDESKSSRARSSSRRRGAA